MNLRHFFPFVSIRKYNNLIYEFNNMVDSRDSLKETVARQNKEIKSLIEKASKKYLVTFDDGEEIIINADKFVSNKEETVFYKTNNQLFSESEVIYYSSKEALEIIAIDSCVVIDRDSCKLDVIRGISGEYSFVFKDRDGGDSNKVFIGDANKVKSILDKISDYAFIEG